MTVKQESTDQPELRTCQRCGSPLPTQKSGRPRRWCSPQCRQAAYEERRGLEGWKDKQPKVNDLSDVVEVVQNRAARRGVARQRPSTGHSAYGPHDCVSTVCTNQLFMAMVVDAVADLVCGQMLVNTREGRFLARGVAHFVEAVQAVAFRVVPAEDFPTANHPESDRS